MHLLTQMFPIRQNSWVFVSDTGGTDPKNIVLGFLFMGGSKPALGQLYSEILKPGAGKWSHLPIWFR